MFVLKYYSQLWRKSFHTNKDTSIGKDGLNEDTILEINVATFSEGPVPLARNLSNFWVSNVNVHKSDPTPQIGISSRARLRSWCSSETKPADLCGSKAQSQHICFGFVYISIDFHTVSFVIRVWLSGTRLPIIHGPLNYSVLWALAILDFKRLLYR